MTRPFNGVAHIRADALRERPELAVRIAVIAAKSAEVEHLFAELLVSLLEAKADVTTVSIYLSLTGSAAREAALRAAAMTRLDAEHYKQFAELVKDTNKRRVPRNQLVHGLWAAPPDMPDALILVDPRAKIQTPFNATQLYEKYQRQEKYMLRHNAPEANLLALRQRIAQSHSRPVEIIGTIYRENDFVEIERRADESIQNVTWFNVRIRNELIA